MCRRSSSIADVGAGKVSAMDDRILGTSAGKSAALLAMVFLLVAGIACASEVLSAAGQERLQPSRPMSSSQIQPFSVEEQLAASYAPIVYLREQDGACDTDGEAYYPAPVEIVLGNPNVSLRSASPGSTSELAGPSAADLFGRDADFYLDLPGDPRRPGCDYERDFLKLAANHPAVAYAHIVREPGFEQLAVQYWFYYYFNDWNNDHEGDWEMVQIVFDATTAEEALREEPILAGFSQHSDGEAAAWDDKKIEKEGDRMVVYVGAGSHANYYDDATYLGRVNGCDDASKPLRRVPLEARLVPAEISGEDDPFAWLEFGGRWGERQPGHRNGPTGPASKGRWNEPITWQNGLRDTSLKVPNISVGPNAAGFFCDVVAFGARHLLGSARWFALSVGIVAVGGIATALARTTYRPALATPLRRRRRFGQILTSALAIQRSRWLFFGAIGACLIPAGMVVMAAQSLILPISPVEALLGVFDNSATTAAFALGLGTVQFGVAYWLILCTVIVTLAELDAGRPVGVRHIYQKIAGSFWPLVRARLASLLTIGLFTLTVIGIPLALRYAVRMTFLEHVILLGGSNDTTAHTASARLVEGRWWRTSGVSAAIAITGIAAGPALGAALVLSAAAPLGAINVISSLVYVLLIPYVAIGLTLLYYDAIASRAERD